MLVSASVIVSLLLKKTRMTLLFKQQCSFVIKLGEMLHRYGTPAFRLEAHLKTVATHLNLDGYFPLSPTTLTYGLWVRGLPDEEVHNYSMRVKPGDLDLGSLSRTDALVNNLIAGQCSLAEAKAGLQDIETSAAPYSTLVSLLAFVFLARGIFCAYAG